MIRVKVSATSANIGSGFDCMGLALDLFNEIQVELSDEFEVVTSIGVPTDKTNLVYASMNEVFKLVSREGENVRLIQNDGIPLASGLGSSAAAIVSGVVAANALMGYPLTADEVNALCVRLDGHPDNVMPALVGGITASVWDGNRVTYVKAHAPKDLIVALATPSFPLPTKEARKALPNSYLREDLVHSLSRAVVTFGALASGRLEKLAVMDDKIHEPYRRPLIKDCDKVFAAYKSAGAISSFVSGAGPTLAAFFNAIPSDIDLPDEYTLRLSKVVNHGVSVEEL